jgi:hypothetical protein
MRRVFRPQRRQVVSRNLPSVQIIQALQVDESKRQKRKEIEVLPSQRTQNASVERTYVDEREAQ